LRKLCASAQEELLLPVDKERSGSKNNIWGAFSKRTGKNSGLRGEKEGGEENPLLGPSHKKPSGTKNREKKAGDTKSQALERS